MRDECGRCKRISDIKFHVFRNSELMDFRYPSIDWRSQLRSEVRRLNRIKCTCDFRYQPYRTATALLWTEEEARYE